MIINIAVNVGPLVDMKALTPADTRLFLLLNVTRFTENAKIPSDRTARIISTTQVQFGGSRLYRYILGKKIDRIEILDMEESLADIHYENHNRFIPRISALRQHLSPILFQVLATSPAIFPSDFQSSKIFWNEGSPFR